MQNPVDFVRESQRKSKNGLFRIATIQGEYVLVTDRHKVAEYIKAADTVLNMQDGANDVCSLVNSKPTANQSPYSNSKYL